MTGLHVDIPELANERLTLRTPRPEDFPAFRAYFASDRSVFTGGPLDERGSWRGFATQLGHWLINGFGMWTIAARESDEPLGHAGLWRPGGWPEPEIGWTVYQGSEGKGIAYEAAAAVRDHVFGTLGWLTVVSYIRDGNLRSVALAERLGARRDDAARRPAHAPDCLVYRHPHPGGAA